VKFLLLNKCVIFDDAFIPPIDVPANWLRRTAVLCVFGLVVAAILTLLQTQRSGLDQDYTAMVLVFIVWMLAAALIGSIYPLADKWFYNGRIHDFKQDWSNAIRSVAILVGIHQASTVQQLSLEKIMIFIYYRKFLSPMCTSWLEH